MIILGLLKARVYFLLVLIELSFARCYAESVRANIG